MLFTFRTNNINKHLGGIFLLLLISLCSACERNNRSQFFALGTVVTTDIRSKPKTAGKFLAEFQSSSLQQDQQFYAWGNGELAKINQSLILGKCAQEISQNAITLFTRAKEISQLSNHLFEPSVAPLVELWNFHDSTKMLAALPSQESIESQLTTLSSIKNLQITANSLCPKQAMQIDFGAIAKGWAAQMANQLLDKHSINNALIDFGGDLVLRGKNSKKQAWKIGLRDPDSESPLASFKLSTNGQSLGVFTSGDYERQFTLDNKNYHHILDPRTGYPAVATRSVTVIHNDPVVADAAATAIFIAGTDWKKVTQALSIQDILIIFPNKQVVISSNLHKKTSWLNETYQVTVVDINSNNIS